MHHSLYVRSPPELREALVICSCHAGLSGFRLSGEGNKGCPLIAPEGEQFVAFTLDDAQFALPLPAVERVIRIVEVTPLPGGPEIVSGVISVQGKILPVLDIRSRFALPPRDARLSDQMIVARTSRRTVSLPVDFVKGVIVRLPREVTAIDEVVTGMRYVAGVSHLDDRIVLIHNLEQFLSTAEEARLNEALDRD